jgi:alpha-beta hydrolase superfamily lysophospholipase
MTAPSAPVVFIHGLWIHSTAWQPWVELYRSAGYDATAPGWPGDSDSVQQTRRSGDRDRPRPDQGGQAAAVRADPLRAPGPVQAR